MQFFDNFLINTKTNYIIIGGNPMKNTELKKNELEKNDVLLEYAAQTETNEDVHFEHVDWTYNDSSCCC